MDSRYSKTNSWGSAAVIFVFLTLLGACSPVSAPEAGPVHKLFELEPAMSRAEMQTDATGFLSRLLDAPSTQEIRLVDVAPQLISGATQELTIPLSNDESFIFHQKSFDKTAAGLLVWSGDLASHRKEWFKDSPEVDIDPFNNVMIVRDGDKLVGSVHVGGQFYKLEAIEDGKHAFIKVDETKVPEDGDPIKDLIPGTDSNVVSSVGPKAAHSTIRVLMVTNNQSRAAWPNINSDIQLAISQANQTNEQGGVAITFELAHILAVNWNESGNTAAILRDLRYADNSLGEEVAKVRDQDRADLVSMVITHPEYCGLGYVSLKKSSGFSVITCFPSLTHELGHSMGVNHDWEPGDPLTTPTYNNGYINRTVAPFFRTLMSYSCGSVSCPKMSLWSTPNKTYMSLPLGTVLYNDNVRWLNERREAVEAYYPSVEKN